MKGVCKPHMVRCAWPAGCDKVFLTRSSKSEGIYCEQHRHEGKLLCWQRHNERRYHRRGKGRPAGGTCNVKTVKVANYSPCDSCAFLQDCKILVKIRSLTHPFCFVESPKHELFVSKYGSIT